MTTVSTSPATRWCLKLTAVASVLALSAAASAQTLSNTTFKVQVGTSGEISSLQIAGDAFPTNYVMNGTNAPGQNTTDHAWVGELMFSYRLGTGAWTTALTNQSSDGRKITTGTNTITVTYENSANAKGIKNFKVVETYALVDDYLSWQIAVTNTGSQTLEMGDFGLPLPFNEYWFQDKDVIYETRTVYHSFTGQNSSYITVQRPSGVGPFLLMTPDATTGAGFEYMDNWVSKEHPGSAWAAGGGNPAWPNGLNVFYIHSNAIKSTNRGYLPNTSLSLAAGASKTYGFKFFKVGSRADVEDRLYKEGLIAVTLVPSMIVATNMPAKIDLRTSKKINAVTAQFPSKTSVTPLGKVNIDHNLYQVTFGQLGQNNIVVSYGDNETTTLQFYVLEPIETALQRHATFMVDKTQWSSGDMKGLFDDWMMDTKAKRGATGGGGWGDDWGWTHGQFLAEKNALTPVASEVTALDNYLDAVWARAIDHTSYVVQDWWCPVGTTDANRNDCWYNRAFAYPHAFNTYFSMYKIADLYPKLVAYHNSADTYLMRAYGILHSLYAGGPPNPDPPETIAGTGYMGEQSLPDIAAALTAAGHTTEAAFVNGAIKKLYDSFSGNTYPYGSEYSYDNTGEEAVYMAARESGDKSVLAKVNAKTRACRGQEPVWYYYADPVGLNGENWWQFQYSAALIGWCMDDYLRTLSTTPEVDARLTYAAKLANLNAINSGQIDSDPANLGTVSWTYQAMKGNVYVYSFEPANSTLHNGWRQMAGEADLGLWGAIRILSADIAVDPIFGLTGYGCDVSESNGCYAVTPTDGVFKRLNLITQKLSMALNRDRYTAATVSTDGKYVGFTLQNQTGDAHITTVTITGLAAGTYPVSVGGTSAASVTAQSGKPTIIALSIGTGKTTAVQIGSGCNGSVSGAGGASGNGGAPGAGGAGGTSGAGGAKGTGGTAGAGGLVASGGVGGSSSGRGGSAGNGGAMGTAGSGGAGNPAGGASGGSGVGGSTSGSSSGKSGGAGAGGANSASGGSTGGKASGGATGGDGSGGSGSGGAPGANGKTSSSGCSCHAGSVASGRGAWMSLMVGMLLGARALSRRRSKCARNVRCRALSD